MVNWTTRSSQNHENPFCYGTGFSTILSQLIMAFIRTFIAADIPNDLKKKFSSVQRKLAPLTKSVRWADPESMHLTFVFLGEISELKVHEACKATQIACEKMDSFSVLVDGLGAFPRIERPRVLWVGIKEGREDLIVLRREIADRVAEAGFQFDNRFEPHITLGRLKRGCIMEPEIAEELQSNVDMPLGEIPLTDIYLYSSKIEKGGPIYSRMATIEL